ncbi:MAG: hypothetical protein WCV80_00215 [Candidatus Paceibacterota bacterium]
MRTFVLFLIFAALCAIAAILCFDIFVTVAERHQLRTNPPAVTRTIPDTRHERHARRLHVDTTLEPTDSTQVIQRSRRVTHEGCTDTLKHDELWDDWN